MQIDFEKELSRKGQEALDRKQREACWKARDFYFACVAERKEGEAREDIKKRCQSAFERFEKDCPRYWVIKMGNFSLNTL